MTHVMRVRNVCEALPAGLKYLLTLGGRESSRAGSVIVAPGPVMTVTRNPQERVLFSAVRDANPFFHCMESLWMLAGGRDAATMNCFVKDFGVRFADGEEVHGAYGYRWRYALGFDQLEHVTRVLREDPTSRQCVIQMWDARPPHAIMDDMGENDLRGVWRDRPCNTHIYLRVRGTDELKRHFSNPEGRVLDLTVCCRSNDAIWGAHGANAVHFSVLQEYLAARIGVGVGAMYQLSNNYHAYASEIERLCRRAGIGAQDYGAETIGAGGLARELEDDRYDRTQSQPMFDVPERADEDVQDFMRWFGGMRLEGGVPFHNRWFHETAARAMRAHDLYRQGHHESAAFSAIGIASPDWREACLEWIQRRSKNASGGLASA